MERCPYEIQYNKLSKEQQEQLPKPCTEQKCILPPAICRSRLRWAYKEKD